MPFMLCFFHGYVNFIIKCDFKYELLPPPLPPMYFDGGGVHIGFGGRFVGWLVKVFLHQKCLGIKAVLGCQVNYICNLGHLV